MAMPAVMPSIEDTLMMEPPWTRMWGMACLLAKMALLRLMSRLRSSTASSRSATVPPTPIPQLFTSTCRAP